jgi:hypothetical protein
MDTNSLMAKILLALVAGVIGFVSAAILDRRKARRDPRKQLSWDASEDRGIGSVRPGVSEKVKILYDGTEVNDLFLVRCNVTNTGNRVVKAQRLRFEFPRGCQILDCYPDPAPPKEYGLAELDQGDQTTERLYSIGQLEVNQRVGLAFVVTGQTISGWAIHPHNNEGDVAFTRRDVARTLEDQAHVSAFLKYLFFLVLLPPIVSGAFGAFSFSDFRFIGTTLASILSIWFLLLLSPHLLPTIRVVTRMLTEPKKDQGHGTTVGVYGEARPNLVFADKILGNVHFKADDEDPVLEAGQRAAVVANQILGNVHFKAEDEDPVLEADQPAAAETSTSGS